MSTYSPVDELTLLMKWAVNEMAVYESPPPHEPQEACAMLVISYETDFWC